MESVTGIITAASYTVLSGIPIAILTIFLAFLWKGFDDWLYTRVTVSAQDESFHWLGHWMSLHQGLKQSQKKVDVVSEEVDGSKCIKYTPSLKSTAVVEFRSKTGQTHRIWINLAERPVPTLDGRGAIKERLYELTILNPMISILFPVLVNIPKHNKFVIEELLQEAKASYDQQALQNTHVNIVHWGSWRETDAKIKRPMNTVHLDANVKDNLIEDVNRFLTNRAWYTDKGVPYRRGYLFHGPPGSGKTSLVMAMAAEFDLPVCVLDLHEDNMNDTVLLKVLSTAPKPSIVLIEEIDTAFGPIDTASSENETPETPVYRKKLGRVSFSGLLNALDGVAAQEGRIIVMTTNHYNRLDPALIRPGRIDKQLELSWPSTQQLEDLYLRMFSEFGHYVKDGTKLREDAERFAQHLTEPGKQVSMADAQAKVIAALNSQNIDLICNSLMQSLSTS